MSIRIHDSRMRAVVELDTRDPGRVSMYVCGPTVYNLIHIGNARTFLWFDFIRQYLVYRGFQVTYVMNYTDVDDKIIERARVEGTTTDVVTAKYTRAFEDDMAALGVAPADALCRATDHIVDMVDAIEGLIEHGAAYVAGGDVFYSVEKFPGYGKLSGRSLEDMRAGDRVEPHEGKSHPLDFALWKAAKEDEPSWPSPWGRGRPGWHIECSVMSTKYLGMGFDLHGGASDLIFPHHENEIAQAEALAGTEPFVRHWMHAGLVQMESVKMSKSLGNVVLAREVAAAYPGEVVRYWALTGSYRTQLSFTDEALADAAQGYERWATFLAAAKHALGPDMPPPPQLVRRPVGADGLVGPGAEYIERFIAALDDDFNSSQAFAVVHELVREANRRIEPAQRGETEDREVLAALTEAFVEMTTMMGFRFDLKESSKLVDDLVEYLLELRDSARRDKEFDRADAIRARLTSMGIAIEDTSAGARWRVIPGPHDGG